jgi:hypothetical protein
MHSVTAPVPFVHAASASACDEDLVTRVKSFGLLSENPFDPGVHVYPVGAGVGVGVGVGVGAGVELDDAFGRPGILSRMR